MRAVPGIKDRELENGGTTNTIFFFYGTVHMDIPGNTTTSLILIDFSYPPSPRCPFSWNSPDSSFHFAQLLSSG